MLQKLTQDDIILLGHKQSARHVWQACYDLGLNLYGSKAHTLTCSIVMGEIGAETFQGPEIVACDAQGDVLPFDPTTSWWKRQNCSSIVTPEQWLHAHLDVLIGASLPEPVKSALRTEVEEKLAIEFLHIWEWEPVLPRVMTVDLTLPPTLAFRDVCNSAGERLDDMSIIQAGHEWETVRAWSHVRDYARLLYGSRATTLEITSMWAYNDMSFNAHPYFYVLDVDQRQVAYDLTLPWWQRFTITPEDIVAYSRRHTPVALEKRSPIDEDRLNWEDSDEVISESIQQSLYILRRDLLAFTFGEVREYQTHEVRIYDLITPPAITYLTIEGQSETANE